MPRDAEMQTSEKRFMPPSGGMMDGVAWDAIVTHQLRTPLCAMTAELERNRNFDPDKMRRNIQRLLRLIDQLHLAGMCRSQGEVNLSVSSLNDLARRIAIKLAPLALDKNQSLSLRCFAKDVQVLMDPLLAGEVLFNLIENAIKYSPSGVDIVVAVTRQGAVHVLDQGPGIDPDDLSMIFEPFKRGRRTLSWSGSGIGLALANKIAEIHHAKLLPHNRRSGGAAFSFQLQRAEPAI